MKTVAEVCRKAIDVIHEDGWVQESNAVANDGRVCIAIAVIRSVRGPLRDQTMLLLAELIGAAAGHPYPVGAVIDYNDHPDTTKERAIALLERAAWKDEERRR